MKKFTGPNLPTVMGISRLLGTWLDRLPADNLLQTGDFDWTLPLLSVCLLLIR